MSVAPHAGVVDFGTFTPPTLSLDGIQGEVPQPLIGQENYVLTGNGWSSLAALGALTYQGTWDASTNTPTLVSSVGVQGYYYVVSVAGSTNLNGITTWDVGDWAIFNGSAWQKIEGGSAGTFQTLTVTGQAALNTISGNTSIADTSTVGKFGVKLAPSFGPGGSWDSRVALFGNVNLATGAGSGALGLSFDTAAGSSLMSIAPGSSWYNIQYLGNVHRFFGLGSEQFRIAATSSTVNYVQVTGAATGGSPTISAQGSDTDINITLTSKGAGAVRFQTAGTIRATVDSGGATNLGISASGGVALKVPATGSQVNFFQMVGAATTTTPVISTLGSDTNVALAIQSKGTGAIDLAAGSSGVNISNGGTVTNYTRSATGSGYTSIPTTTISAPTTAGGVQATAFSVIQNSAATIANGGTGYTVGNVLTMVGGTIQSGSAGTFTVSAVSAGVITAVTVLNFGQYNAIPTNPVTVTGGSGSGATLNVSYIYGYSVSINAGSGYVEQPTVTITGGGGSGAAAYATVGSGTIVRSIGSTMSIHTPGGEQARFGDTFAGGTAVNYWSLQGRSVGAQPAFSVVGSDTNISAQYNTKGSGTFLFYTNSGAQLQATIAHTASAVNYVQVTGNTTNNNPTISAQGSDANPSLWLTAKGSGQVVSRSWFTAAQASANYWQMAGAGAGTAPIISTLGSDTNIPIALQPKGTGAIDLAAGSSGVNISNGNTVTAITRTAAGNNYTSPPTIAISAPTTAGGVQATATCQLGLVNITITSGGTGYTLGDVLTVVGGTFTIQQTFTVTGVSSGVITLVSGNGASYSVLPSNPVTLTGGTGTGASFTITWGLAANSIFTITAAGSGYIEQPTVTFSGGGGSGAAAYATVGTTTVVRSLGATMQFQTPGGIQFAVSDSSATSGAYWQAVGGNATADLRTAGAGVIAGAISTQTAVPILFRTAFLEQFRVAHTAAAVNYFQVQGSATGNATGPIMSMQGSDTNISTQIQGKGTGSVAVLTPTSLGGTVGNTAELFSAKGFNTNQAILRASQFRHSTGTDWTTASLRLGQRIDATDMSFIEYNPVGFAQGIAIQAANNQPINFRTNGEQFRVAPTTTAVNYQVMSGSAANNSVQYYSAGSDTNISMAIQPKGTGAINLAAGSRAVNISNGSTVTNISRTAQGSGYTTLTGLIWTASAPTTTGGSTATGTVTSLGGVSATLVNGGTGYTAGDVLTVVGGTFSSTSSIRVDTVSGGVITAATLTNGGTYTVIPSNPASVTGGSGTGATFNVAYGILGLAIGAAGSGYVEQPTITFSGGGGSGASAFASVGAVTTFRTLHTEMQFHTAGGVGFEVQTYGAGTTTSRFCTFASSSGNPAILESRGAATNISAAFSSKGTSALQFYTNSLSLGSGVEQFRVSHIASAVNYVQVTGAATGGLPIISVQGSDANIPLAINSKGTSSIRLGFNNTDYLAINTATAGTNYIQSLGGSANIDIGFIPKGTGNIVGNVNSGSFTIGRDSANNAIKFTAPSGNLYLQTTGGGVILFNTGDGTPNQMRVAHTASAVNYVQVTGATTSNRPRISFEGSDGNIGGLYVAKGSGGHSFCSDSNASVVQFAISRTASAVNYIQVTGGAAASAWPNFSIQGSDTNIGVELATKGTGSFRFNTAGAVQQFRITDTTSAVNYLQATGGITGAAATLSAGGTDTNIDISFVPKGTGRVKYGTHTATADVPITGYIEIVDSGGTIRKLAVIT